MMPNVSLYCPVHGALKFTLIVLSRRCLNLLRSNYVHATNTVGTRSICICFSTHPSTVPDPSKFRVLRPPSSSVVFAKDSGTCIISYNSYLADLDVTVIWSHLVASPEMMSALSDRDEKQHCQRVGDLRLAGATLSLRGKGVRVCGSLTQPVVEVIREHIITRYALRRQRILLVKHSQRSPRPLCPK